MTSGGAAHLGVQAVPRATVDARFFGPASSPRVSKRCLDDLRPGRPRPTTSPHFLALTLATPGHASHLATKGLKLTGLPALTATLTRIITLLTIKDVFPGSGVTFLLVRIVVSRFRATSYIVRIVTLDFQVTLKAIWIVFP